MTLGEAYPDDLEDLHSNYILPMRLSPQLECSSFFQSLCEGQYIEVAELSDAQSSGREALRYQDGRTNQKRLK